MRKRYKATFRVGRDSSPSLKDVADECLAWATHRMRPTGLPVNENIERTTFAGRGEVETLWHAEDEGTFWGLRFSHPDKSDPTRRWTTDITLAQREATGLVFSCTVAVASTAGMVLPTRVAPSRPRIVLDVLQRWGGHHGHALSVAPEVLRTSNIDHFVDLIFSPQRSRPIVWVSARNRDDRTMVDGIQLANWLSSLAHVFVSADRYPSLDLREDLPRRWNCWDGAVRVYWPRLKLSDDAYAHRIWLADDLHEIERDLTPHGFKEHLLGYLSDVAVYGEDSDELTWLDLEHRRRRGELEKLRVAGDANEMLPLYEEDNRALRTQIEQLREECDTLRRERAFAKQQAETWRESYVASRKSEGFQQDLDRPPATVAEAIEKAQSEFGTQLLFAPNGKSKVDKNEFESPPSVLAALEFLATVYHQARIGKKPCADFDAALRQRCGWTFSAHQSEITMNRYEDWYTTRAEKKKIWLDEHIGTGTSKEERYTIRIGFSWEKDLGKVVIGYIGQHQKTDAT
jgi:hypothetical protein